MMILNCSGIKKDVESTWKPQIPQGYEMVEVKDGQVKYDKIKRGDKKCQ